MKQKLLPTKEIFQARRSELVNRIRTICHKGIVIIGTAPELARNRDSDFPYRHDSDFYYLTGFTEPESFLVMQIDHDKVSSHLFC
jgi:Xaa-Pro aminopeptidase